MKSLRLACVTITLLCGSVFSVPFAQQSQSDDRSFDNNNTRNSYNGSATNGTVIPEFSFELAPRQTERDEAAYTYNVTKNLIGPVPSEHNYRISVSEPKRPDSGKDDDPETRNRRINDSDINVLIAAVPNPQLLKDVESFDNQAEETTAPVAETTTPTTEAETSVTEEPTPETPPPIISPIIMYSIIASVVVLVISLLIIIIMVCYIVVTTPKEIDSLDDCCGGDDDDVACVAPGKSKQSAASKKSDNFCCDEDSEQTVDLMDKGSSCSSRKGSCMICPKTMRRSSRKSDNSSQNYFVSCVCDLPENDASYSSSTATTIARR